MNKLAHTIPEAADLTSISEDIIRKAIRRGELNASYPSSRPVIRTSELERWLEALPVDRAAAS